MLDLIVPSQAACILLTDLILSSFAFFLFSSGVVSSIQGNYVGPAALDLSLGRPHPERPRHSRRALLVRLNEEYANMIGDLPAGTITTTTPTAAITTNSSGNGAGTGSSSSSTRLPVAARLEHIGRDCRPPRLRPFSRVRAACGGRTPAESLWSRVYERSNAPLGSFVNLFGPALYFVRPATPLALPTPAITAAEEDEEEDEEEEEEEREVKKEEDEKEDIKEEEEKEIKEEGEE
ncbi:hypothetical protein G7054_g1022 [Neopestalotiopsis clavispora]|nr:hypothetical protein G7054_g1022 [Neopestalotiopsis clavispora]